jgi:hypothetical protein
MAGLDPAIPAVRLKPEEALGVAAFVVRRRRFDGRVKPGHDG